MRYLAGIFALLTGAAGWFYLFYSRGAHGLSGIEDQRLNGRRIALRRVGGLAMLLLGGFFFALFYAFEDPHRQPALFLGVLVAVFLLLIVLVVLAMIDVRLTRRLRRDRNRRGFPVE
jgi:drug/metabolite transporter (DMT)-like permease